MLDEEARSGDLLVSSQSEYSFMRWEFDALMVSGRDGLHLMYPGRSEDDVVDRRFVDNDELDPSDYSSDEDWQFDRSDGHHKASIKTC